MLRALFEFFSLQEFRCSEQNPIFLSWIPFHTLEIVGYDNDKKI